MHVRREGPACRTEVPETVSETMGLEASSVVTSGVLTRSWTRPDGRRSLQLVLATLWLIDGILQLQAAFFTRSFGAEMIAGGAAGNPAILARPIHWSGETIGHHAVPANALFALCQMVLGLGIAWRPSLKPALVASIAWSLGVWWIGEGLGGVLNGGANPVDGAPGAVILYALAAVLLWPSDRPGRIPGFIAGRAVGGSVAKGLWAVLWGSLAYFAVLGANRSPRGLHGLLAGEADGEPGWVAWIDRHSASMVAGHGQVVMVMLASLLVLVAAGVYLPEPAANAVLVVAIVISAWFWVVGQDFGELFTNGATDVNSGPLLILLALAYWNTDPPGRRRDSHLFGPTTSVEVP